MVDLQQQEETRKFGRYNVSHDVELRFGETSTLATITNESIGGARLEFASRVYFSVGSEVSIRQGDTETVGYVRNLGCLEDGDGMFAGVSWERPEVDDTPCATANFLRYGKLEVVCRDRQDQPNGHSKIQLFDGKVFVADTSSLIVCSRDSRSATLSREGSQLQVLAKLYGINSTGNRDDVVKRVLEFEFASA